MNYKRLAAEQAVSYVRSGMVLGLGTGSTSAYAIDKIGELIEAGKLKDIKGVPTSVDTVNRADELHITLTTLDEHPIIDLTIDGADEVDPQLNLIKGLGGALLREKIVESASRQFIVIVDESKLVERLGTRGPLPVEVTQFAWRTHCRWLETLGCKAERRQEASGAPFVTDNGNYIIHCFFPNGIDNLAELDQKLKSRPGILEHGLFLGLASMMVVAGKGGVRTVQP